MCEVREIVEAEASIENASGSGQSLSDDQRLAVDGLSRAQAVLRNLDIFDQQIREVLVAREAGNVFAGRQATKQQCRNQVAGAFQPDGVGIDRVCRPALYPAC